MKKYIVVSFAFLLMFNCSNNDDNDPIELVGRWLLIEQYSDPGDGSGDFVAVISDKTIEFDTDGSMRSNGSLCQMDTESNEETTGTYDDAENTITPEGCAFPGFGLTYEIIGRNLIVNFPCIEGCQQKYRKIN